MKLCASESHDYKLIVDGNDLGWRYSRHTQVYVASRLGTIDKYLTRDLLYESLFFGSLDAKLTFQQRLGYWTRN